MTNSWLHLVVMGAGFSVDCPDEAFFDKLSSRFPLDWITETPSQVREDCSYKVHCRDNEHGHRFYRCEQPIYQERVEAFMSASMISSLLAAHLCSQAVIARPDLLFLHAGSCAWGQRGFVWPADCLAGKSTLARSLTKEGAEYFSDDIAVVDEDLNVHPFPLTPSRRSTPGQIPQENVLSLRVDRIPAPVPLGAIVLVEFDKDCVVPQVSSIEADQVALELTRHVLSPWPTPQRWTIFQRILDRGKFLRVRRGCLERSGHPRRLLDLLLDA
jgi:hypothetical protein